MIVISPTDFRVNQQKYFDMAKTEKVFVKQGRQLIELVAHPSDITEEDLNNGISGKQLIEEVKANIMRFKDK